MDGAFEYIQQTTQHGGLLVFEYTIGPPVLNLDAAPYADLALSMGFGALGPTHAEDALHLTFSHRRTHELPPAR